MLYLLNNLPRVAELFGQHLFLTISSLALAILLGLPIGILIFRIEPLRGPVLAVLGVIYTIPSLSLLVLLIPLTGLSPATALVVRTIASGIIQRAVTWIGQRYHASSTTTPEQATTKSTRAAAIVAMGRISRGK